MALVVFALFARFKTCVFRISSTTFKWVAGTMRSGVMSQEELFKPKTVSSMSSFPLLAHHSFLLKRRKTDFQSNVTPAKKCQEQEPWQFKQFKWFAIKITELSDPGVPPPWPTHPWCPSITTPKYFIHALLLIKWCRHGGLAPRHPSNISQAVQLRHIVSAAGTQSHSLHKSCEWVRTKPKGDSEWCNVRQRVRPKASALWGSNADWEQWVSDFANVSTRNLHEPPNLYRSRLLFSRPYRCEH